MGENSTKESKVGWRSPSNLAIVKYWGKYGTQFPRNTSLSLTLTNAFSETYLQWKEKSDLGIKTSFLFEGKERPDFKTRIDNFLAEMVPFFPFLEKYHLEIHSHNSFPHSSGIASSASAMSALALCLVSMEDKLSGTLKQEEAFLQKASFIARLGSGSASRSVYGSAAIWGEHPRIPSSSQEFAIPWDDAIDSVFKSFHDDILIVSPEEKSVSSSAGHTLMVDNVYASARYQQAQDRMELLIKAMKEGDVQAFGKIAEDEALTLHALMMCSDPSYMLIEPGSVAIMKKVRSFRRNHQLPVYFSLDAGPNIHLLYPDNIHAEVNNFINDELKQHCFNGKILPDMVGNGPQALLGE